MPKVYEYSGFANKIVEVQMYEFWSTKRGEIENTNQDMYGIYLFCVEKISLFHFAKTYNRILFGLFVALFVV